MRFEFGGLWRHRDFLKLWSAQATSVFGSQLASLVVGACGMILPFLRLFFSPVRDFNEDYVGKIE